MSKKMTQLLNRNSVRLAILVRQRGKSVYTQYFQGQSNVSLMSFLPIKVERSQCSTASETL